MSREQKIELLKLELEYLEKTTQYTSWFKFFDKKIEEIENDKKSNSETIVSSC